MVGLLKIISNFVGDEKNLLELTRLKTGRTDESG